MKSFLYRILCGFCLGISVFAPGISGSIMAIILGIYEKIIDITSNPFKEFKKNVKFLFPIGIGVGISLVFFVLVFSWLFETYEIATYFLFIGLIIGNLPVVFKDANKNKFKWYYVLGAIITFGVAFTVGCLSESSTAINVTTGETNLLYFALCGALAGAASLVPGMSVSMILIVMGVYDFLLETAKTIVESPVDFRFDVVAVVGISFVLALVLSSRLIKFIFNKFNGMANYMVIGFLVGSVGGIIYTMFIDKTQSISYISSGIMLVIGLVISLLFVYLGKKVDIDKYD